MCLKDRTVQVLGTCTFRKPSTGQSQSPQQVASTSQHNSLSQPSRRRRSRGIYMATIINAVFRAAQEPRDRIWYLHMHVCSRWHWRHGHFRDRSSEANESEGLGIGWLRWTARVVKILSIILDTSQPVTSPKRIPTRTRNGLTRLR